MAGVRNDLLQLPALREAWFRRKSTTRNLHSKYRTTTFMRFLPYTGFHSEDPLYYLYYVRTKEAYVNTVLHMYYTRQIKWTVTNMAQCTVRATIRLEKCGSRSFCYTFRAVSAISGQELQKVFNNLFTRCQACLESWKRSFPVPTPILCTAYTMPGNVAFKAAVQLSMGLPAQTVNYHLFIAAIYITGGTTTRLRTGRSRVQIPSRAWDFLFPRTSRPASYSMDTGVLSRGYDGRV